MVASLAGLNRARGDRITVARIPLSGAGAPPSRTGVAAMLAAAWSRHGLRAGLGGLPAPAVLSFLLIARRDLRRGRAASR